MLKGSSTKIKALWHSTGRGLSLKQFVRELAEGDSSDAQSAKDWFSNKKEVNQKEASEKRLKDKGPMLTTMKNARVAAKSKGSK